MCAYCGHVYEHMFGFVLCVLSERVCAASNRAESGAIVYCVMMGFDGIQ